MKKVTLISPCYNGANYLHFFLNSVLQQTYNSIKLVLVDDGSTDSTREICDSYKEKFAKRGIEFVYVYKENGGQASAINLGLQFFDGEYLMWPDSDDILLPKNIEKKVTFLELHQDIDFVFCEGHIVDANNLDKVIGRMRRKPARGKDMIFSDYIYEKNVVFPPACTMVTRKAFDENISNRNIYEGRQGQNWQIMLPISYNCRCGYIKEPLFKYVVHTDSHSHSPRSIDDKINRANGFKDILFHTIDAIKNMPDAEKVEWHNKVSVKYWRKELYLAFNQKEKERVRELKCMIKSVNGKKTIRETTIFCIIRNMIYGDRI